MNNNVVIRLLRSRKFVAMLVGLGALVAALVAKEIDGKTFAAGAVPLVVALVLAIAAEDVAEKSAKKSEAIAAVVAEVEPVTKRSPGSIVPPLGVLAIVAIVALVGCGGAKSAQDEAQNAIAEIARGVAAADQACAAIVRDRTISESTRRAAGEKCVAGYRLARHSLIAAEQVVSTWEAGAEKKLGCAAVHAGEGLAAIVSSVADMGVKLPPEVAKAANAAHLLGLVEDLACGR